MTRVDFVSMARVLSQEREVAKTKSARQAIDHIAVGIGAYCEFTNGNFRTEQFLAACGIPIQQ